jgi:hypothetical protein
MKKQYNVKMCTKQENTVKINDILSVKETGVIILKAFRIF